MPRVARIVISGNEHQPAAPAATAKACSSPTRTAGRISRSSASRPRSTASASSRTAWMTNHVHLVVTPPHGDALAKAVGRTHYLYAQYVNRLHRRSGHLWQSRFHSCVLDDSHLANTMAYVERNPVRAG
ncbi:MAG TPA: transposase, partial [Planctomycetota bacterium]|nr:transposase [Planctomycetota bacterium]